MLAKSTTYIAQAASLLGIRSVILDTKTNRPLSGAKPEQAGSQLELTTGGKNPIQLANGEPRGFLEEGDT
jgi:hypothetical protein